MTQIIEFAVIVIVISASGVMSPGPLFAANVSYGLREGTRSGIKMAIGHTIVEFPLIILLGIGVFSYFGLSQKYDEGCVGRYYIQEGTLIGLTIMPSISYRVSEMISLGFGLNIMYGIFDQKVAINNLGQQPDGMGHAGRRPDRRLRLAGARAGQR